ncbi:flagellar biosynthesis protein FlhA [Pseudoprimorskyibacter insulae]|uniref:Flagellar biosynthesis protein FlhA n=1 Tax=Pseudoprimorskyibacter insulae TaxID=1695997 RepID=A0A2R8AVU7_9RHOB|nr:flagellar biosynthesis protein FlhA [Pseudoprimorskyibacter insulae]SPF80057.1 Flagellar biosynthesis protein FlhA [Pseudoprimorskyibacter insulae]
MITATGQSRGEQMGSALLPMGILAVVAMMVLPLPVALLDMFFVFNILLSLLVLMVAMHSYRPLDFSSFPTLLLIATTLRLALNVASTRIVLTEGHTGAGAAGQVIEAFGSFVIGGNFAVGIVVFAILMIINLVVITKGAGRVSEVSARFTLDAMPGKQMAIDADLNAGILTPDEARTRRSEVGQEADFYGAMDGASKFVKGDAIAGILILVANILGGIIIGTSQHALSFGQAAQTYVLLSIGDGLVAQIPSLLLSIATAIIVTRVSSDLDMASHIGKQIGISRAWIPVSAVLAILGLVPGIPTGLFLIAAVIAAGVAYVTRNAEAREGEEAAQSGAPAPRNALRAAQAQATEDDENSGVITAEDVTDYAPVTIQIGLGLIPLIDEAEGGDLVSRITGIRKDVSKAMGFVVPGVRIRDEMGLQSSQYRIKVGQAIVAEDTVYADRVLALPGGMSTRKLRGVEVKDPSFGMDAIWILPHQRAEAEADDHIVIEPSLVIATHLSQLLITHGSRLLGPDDVQNLLERLSQHAPTLVDAVVPKLVPLHTLTAVMRHLLADRIPVSDLPAILEGLAELAGRNLEPRDMAEALRPSLVPLLLQQIAAINTELPLITLVPELEELLLRSNTQGVGLVIEQGLTQQILQALSTMSEDMAGQGRQAVVVVSAALRRAFAGFLRAHGSDAIVIAVSELPENRRIEIVGTLGGASQLPPQGGQ